MNDFLRPQVIAATALGLLARDIVLPGLVWRDAVSSWDGAADDTVTIRVPARAKARRRTLRSGGAITADPLRETPVKVTLDTEVYHAANVSDAELTLDITDFGAQVLAAQTRAVAEDLEDQVAAEMTAATYATTLTLDTAKPENTLVDGRAALNTASVPRADRFAVLGSDMESVFLKSETITRADASGADTALREAELGRLRGFAVYGSNALPPTTGYLFHRSAFVLGLRAPVVPDGATFGESQTYMELAMRWLRDYDATTLADRSVVSTFAGTAAVVDGPPAVADGPATFVRAVKVTMA